MKELIDKIEESVSKLLAYDTKGFGESAQELVNMMMLILPAIINYYNDPKMVDVREDALYWPGQMERIIKTLENDDSIEIIDVLYNETRPNLLELMNKLTEKGLM